MDRPNTTSKYSTGPTANRAAATASVVAVPDRYNRYTRRRQKRRRKDPGRQAVQGQDVAEHDVGEEEHVGDLAVVDQRARSDDEAGGQDDEQQLMNSSR